MLINSKILAAALILGAAATPAMAEDFYGALDFGQTKAKDACEGAGALGVAGCEDTANAFRIAGGFQFAPMWGAEVSYGNYGKASLGTFGALSLGDWKLTGFQVSGTGTFPLGEDFALIGKLGIASTKLELTAASLSETSTELAFGVGAQYDFTKNVAVRAQYEDLGKVGDDNTTGTTKVTLLSAGLVFKF